MAKINFIKTIFFLIFINLNLLAASTEQEWNLVCESNNDRHPHENFCFRFYECKEDDVGNFEIYLRSCLPEGLRRYNETEKKCEDGPCPTEPDPCSRSSLFSGTQEWDFQCTSNNERYQHESNCSRFYWCVENDLGNFDTKVESCDLGRVFNELLQRCVNGNCETPSPTPCPSTTITTPMVSPNSTTASTETTTPTASTEIPTPTASTEIPTPTASTQTPIPTTPTTPTPPFTCVGKETGYYPDPQSCKNYYRCFNLEATHHACPPDAMFFYPPSPTCIDSCQYCSTPALCP